MILSVRRKDSVTHGVTKSFGRIAVVTLCNQSVDDMEIVQKAISCHKCREAMKGYHAKSK